MPFPKISAGALSSFPTVINYPLVLLLGPEETKTTTSVTRHWNCNVIYDYVIGAAYMASQ